MVEEPGAGDPSLEGMVRAVEEARSALYGVLEGRDPGAVARACLELAGEVVALAAPDDPARLGRLLDAACRVTRDRALAVRRAEALLDQRPAGEA